MNRKASSRLAKVGDRIQRDGPETTVGDVVDSLGPTGLGLMLLVLTLLSAVPGISGLIFGPMIALLSIQVVIGARRLWLPEFVRRRRLRSDRVQVRLANGVSALQRVESWLEPRRLLPLTNRVARLALAIPLFSMAAIMTLPLPFGNVAPAAALIVLSLGLVTRDGLAIILGWVLSVVALVWTATILWHGAKVLEWITDKL